MKTRGFTLIELLVTVTIIAVLSAIGLVIYRVVLEQGRDSKRQSDLRTIQSALEQYYADQFFYPTSALDYLISGTSQPGPAFTSNTGNPSPSSIVKTYINALPLDPTYAGVPGRYWYVPSPDQCDNSTSNRCTAYCIYAKLEGSSPGTGNCIATGYSYNFAVTPP